MKVSNTRATQNGDNLFGPVVEWLSMFFVFVVEWLYYFKRIIIVRWADLSDFFR